MDRTRCSFVPMTCPRIFILRVTIARTLTGCAAGALILEIHWVRTAIGTGINTDPRYAELVRRGSLRTGLTWSQPRLVEATQDDRCVRCSVRCAKRVAQLSKIATIWTTLDGPRAGRRNSSQPCSRLEHLPGKGTRSSRSGNHPCFHSGNDLTGHGSRACQLS